MLTAHDATGHVHLILGSNAITHNRCQRSLDVQAKPIVFFGEDAAVHYALQEKVASGSVDVLKRDFQDSDLTTLGRAEIENVVDAVFVTSGRSCARSTAPSLSMSLPSHASQT